MKGTVRRNSNFWTFPPQIVNGADYSQREKQANGEHNKNKNLMQLGKLEGLTENIFPLSHTLKKDTN